MPGLAIIGASWASVVLFAATAVPSAVGVDALDGTALVVALGLFALSIPVWAYAFARAVVRTTRGDDVAVANLFFLQGSAPGQVQVHLFGALAACLAVTVATAAADPFGVLVPMLPLGLIGLWAARHGVFPPRRGAAGATSGARSDG